MEADACMYTSNINTRELMLPSSLLKNISLFQQLEALLLPGFSSPELQSEQDLTVYLFFQVCFAFNVII